MPSTRSHFAALVPAAVLVVDGLILDRLGSFILELSSIPASMSLRQRLPNGILAAAGVDAVVGMVALTIRSRFVVVVVVHNSLNRSSQTSVSATPPAKDRRWFRQSRYLYCSLLLIGSTGGESKTAMVVPPSACEAAAVLIIATNHIRPLTKQNFPCGDCCSWLEYKVKSGFTSKSNNQPGIEVSAARIHVKEDDFVWQF
jgi:hypothetical protein